jgi:hypothetical protein
VSENGAVTLSRTSLFVVVLGLTPGCGSSGPPPASGGRVGIDRFGLSFHIGSNPKGESRKWYDDVVAATSYIGPVSGP